MSRRNIMVTAALLSALAVHACGDDPVPPAPTGSIAGQVTIEGQGIDGVTVTLNGGTTATTAGGGSYRFDDMAAGDYKVTISDYPAGSAFDATAQSAGIADDGELITVNFAGSWIRTSAIMGAVTVENDGLSGVTVKISGLADAETQAGTDGQYAFSGLRAGDYTIEISGFDPDDVTFASTSSAVTVAVDETQVVAFAGTYVRTSAVMGQVSVGGNPLEGVTVSLQGRGEDRTYATNGAGQYMFEVLRSGEYSIGISSYDTDEYGFAATTRTVSVAPGETASVPFEGTALRTAAIMGRVTIEGTALEGVTVSLRGKGEERSASTDATGQFEFDRLHAGEYSIGISGYDTDEYGFETTSEGVQVALDETAKVAFDGIPLRTAVVMGRVSVDGSGLEGVTVNLVGREDRSGATGDDGRFGFEGLAAGDYTLSITGYDADEFDFDASREITLALAESKIADFAGRSLRTAGVTGTVMAEGEAVAGVSVTLTEAGEVLGTVQTGSEGDYSFAELLAGTYRVEISGFDAEYDFTATTWTGTVATDRIAEADFSATIIRTASVSGLVSVDDAGLAGVTVTLTGEHAPEDNTIATDKDGGYAFDGLRKGGYTVTVTNPDEDLYAFPATSLPVNLSVGQAREKVSFAGETLRKASIGGRVHVEGVGLEGVTVVLSGDADAEEITDGHGEYDFAGLAGGDYSVEISGWDEVAYEFGTTEANVGLEADEARTTDFRGEHTATASVGGVLFLDEIEDDGALTEGEPELSAEIPLLLHGPGVRDVRTGTTNPDGTYSFEGLKAGSYRVLVSRSDSLAKALGEAGYRFTGKAMGQMVEVSAGAAETANFPFRIIRQTILVGAAMGDATQVGDPVGGVIVALYPTAGDAEAGTNRLGTATTLASGDEAGFATFEFAREEDADRRVFATVTGTGHSDLVVVDDNPVEVRYEAIERTAGAPAALRLLNTRVDFRWSVKSDADARGGDRFLPGWLATNGVETDGDGRATYSDKVDVSDLPATFTVALDGDADQPDMGERWVQSAALTHVHDGLSLPASNAAAGEDLGSIRITWITQTLVAGVYREADDAPGYTNYQSRLPGGDHRPAPSVGEEMTIELLVQGDDGLERYRWDHDNNPYTEMKVGLATVGPDGLVRFAGIPADDEITIRFHEGDDRVLISELDDVETFGGDLDIGATAGAFGALSGGGPEVRICTASEETSDDRCATFGYQWTTGAVSGNVGRAGGHRVVLDPAADVHGALADTTTSGSSGTYGFTGLQDGEYAVTASGTSTYRVDGDATQPVWVYHDERAGEAGTDKARWTTSRIDLKIMGYIGNDADGDRLMSGDEALAGVAVRLTRGPETVATVETDGSGLYVFENLAEGRYGVTASSGSDYLVLRGFDPDTDGAIATAAAIADEYPAPRAGKYRLPSWDYAKSSAVNTSVKVRKPGSTALATLVNFALIHTDGELSGGIENVSGGAADIGLRIHRERDGQVTEVSTDSRGRYETDELVEGSYRVEIVDARYAAPCLSAADGTPDDDGPDADGDGECDHMAATEIDADLRGGQAHADLPVLHVYDIKLFADDSLGDLPGIEARMQGRYSDTYNDPVTWDPAWIRTPDSEETHNAESVGTISWASKSVTFSFPADESIPAGASVAVRKDTTVCANHTCELDFNRTGTPGRPSPKETTLTVTVTAENGYDDHIYTVAVARANPVGNDLSTERVRRYNADDTSYTAATGYGTADEPYTLLTDSAKAGSLKLHVNLRHLGVLNDNAACAQSLVVKTNPDDEDAEAEEVGADAGAEDDICANERYTLGVAKEGSRYTLHVLSEDGVEKVHHLALDRGPEG